MLTDTKIKTNIPFSPPDITDVEINNVVEVLKSGWITTGPKTKEFERKIAEYCNTNKSICLNSATACMEMTLRLLGIGEGDEVITSAYTYTASASVIHHVGAKIVLIDTAKDSYEMDYEKLEEALVENTTIDGIENLSVSLNSCIFKNVVFEYCDFRRIDMTDIIFENCDLSNINFPYSSLYRVEFINCKLTGCNFNDFTLKSVVFKNCLGRYSNFAFSKFSGVSIENSDFSFAVFQEIKNETLLLDSNNLTKSVFTGTSLNNVDFTNSDIDGIEVRLKDVYGGTFSANQALDLSKLMGISIK